MTTIRESWRQHRQQERDLARAKYEALAQEKRQQFLARGGQPETVLSSAEDVQCDTCGGLRWVTVDVAYDDPQFGKARPCPSCKPRVDAMSLFDLMTVPEEYSDKAKKQLTDAIEKCRKIAQHFIPTSSWLVLIGPNGCGKSHLAKAVLAGRWAHGERSLFLTAEEVIQRLRETNKPDSEVSMGEQLESYRRLDWLAIDELGKERQTDFAVREVEALINRRYSDRSGLIVTANFDVLNDANVSPAVRSRLGDRALSEVVYMDAVPDFRRRRERKSTR